MENHNVIPSVCIVGRPNVGKSSLFNRLLGQRKAVVVEQSGTTRDRVEGAISVRGRQIRLVDTGGYLREDRDELSLQVQDQIRDAMDEAVLIVMVVDCISGVTPADTEIASLLRKYSKNMILVANKADNDKIKACAVDFFELGIGDPEPVSCLHGRGIRHLKARIYGAMEAPAPQKQKEAPRKYLNIAVVGRPNVGKSSFVNNLLARERIIVSDVPGTTRDSIDTFFSYNGDDFILIDTAGIRHRRKVKHVVDAFSMMRSREAIKRSDVTVLMLDAADGVTKDDLGILDMIEEDGKACLVLVNKWDLANDAPGVTPDGYREDLVEGSRRLEKYPIRFISSSTGKNVLGCIPLLKTLDSRLDLDASTAFLNKIFDKKDPSDLAVPRSKKRPNFLYVVQSGRRPVEFKFFVNDPSAVLPAHIRFIENHLRANLPLEGIPVKIKIRKSRKEDKK